MSASATQGGHNKQCETTEGNSERWLQPEKITHQPHLSSFLDPLTHCWSKKHWASSIPVLWQQDNSNDEINNCQHQQQYAMNGTRAPSLKDCMLRCWTYCRELRRSWLSSDCCQSCYWLHSLPTISRCIHVIQLPSWSGEFSEGCMWNATKLLFSAAPFIFCCQEAHSNSNHKNHSSHLVPFFNHWLLREGMSLPLRCHCIWSYNHMAG